MRVITRAKQFCGQPLIPGDKSISHRALILGALALGRTEIRGLLESEDVQATAGCLQALGVCISKRGELTTVERSGSRGWMTPREGLDCKNSGTTLRVLMGVLAGNRGDATTAFTAHLMGDRSLLQRPMRRVAEPLQQMGASIQLTHFDCAPVTVIGRELHGIDYELKIASAQIKTALLLAGLSAQGRTCLTGAIQSRDHTERMLGYFGGRLQTTPNSISVMGGQVLSAAQIQVPGDLSAAAFWMTAASLLPRSEITLEGMSLNPTRMGFIHALRAMGGQIVIEPHESREDFEPIGKIRVFSASRLRGIFIPATQIASLIDELPLLAVLATQATGCTEVVGAEELRFKETDRLTAIASGLRAMGAEVEVRPDGFLIEGPQKLWGAPIQSFQDHRIAMAFSIAGLIAEGETVIQDSDCVSISYPDFYRTLERWVTCP